MKTLLLAALLFVLAILTMNPTTAFGDGTDPMPLCRKGHANCPQ
jgi:hypothetical protein